MTPPIPAQRRALFVQAVSPGQLLRVLERLRREAPDLPPVWWLTTPRLPHGFRALIAAPGASDAEARAAARFSTTLGTPVYVLRIGPDGWEYTRWEAGAETARTDGAHVALPWWRRLPGILPLRTPWQVWGQEQGLPVMVLENAPPSNRGGGRIVAYRTVRGLDQRGLLIERKNGWYALTLGET